MKIREWFKSGRAKVGALLALLGSLRPIWDAVLFALDLPGRRDTFWRYVPAIARQWWISPALVVLGLIIIWLDVRRRSIASLEAKTEKPKQVEEREQPTGNSFSLKTASRTHANGSITYEGELERSIDLSELKNVRMIDRGSSEERKALWEQKPDVVLEWISGKGGAHDKIGLRNIGKQSAFNVKLGPFSWPEFQFPIPREVNVIHPDNQEIIEAAFIEKRDHALHIGSLDSFLREPRYSDRAPLALAITFADSHGALFQRTFSFGFGPGGRWGPLVFVTLGQIRQLP